MKNRVIFLGKPTLKNIIVILCFAAALSSCSNTSYVRPTMIDDEFSNRKISSITILPFLDFRADKKVEFNFGGHLTTKISGLLIVEKGYRVQIDSTKLDTTKFDKKTIINPPAEWVKNLGGHAESYPMLIILNDISSAVIIGRVAAVNLTAVLYDKSAGEVIWHNQSTAIKLGIGILALVNGEAFYLERALDKAVLELMRGFPDKAN